MAPLLLLLLLPLLLVTVTVVVVGIPVSLTFGLTFALSMSDGEECLSFFLSLFFPSTNPPDSQSLAAVQRRPLSSSCPGVVVVNRTDIKTELNVSDESKGLAGRMKIMRGCRCHTQDIRRRNVKNTLRSGLV